MRLANATPYGLAAYVWTNDIRRAHRVAQAIDTGMCWINSQNVRDLRTPFGGVKQSGIGREGGDYAFDFYCDTEIVHVALGSHHIPRLGLAGARRSRMSAAIDELARARPPRAAVRHPPRGLRRARRHRPRRLRALLRRPARPDRQRAHDGRALPARLGGALAPLARAARGRRSPACAPARVPRPRESTTSTRSRRSSSARGCVVRESSRASSGHGPRRCASGTRSASRSSSSTR